MNYWENIEEQLYNSYKALNVLRVISYLQACMYGIFSDNQEEPIYEALRLLLKKRRGYLYEFLYFMLRYYGSTVILYSTCLYVAIKIISHILSYPKKLTSFIFKAVLFLIFSIVVVNVF
jgi:hypothetical protein